MTNELSRHRGVAQPGLERLVRDQEVAGSNPVAPIRLAISAIDAIETTVGIEEISTAIFSGLRNVNSCPRQF